MRRPRSPYFVAWFLSTTFAGVLLIGAGLTSAAGAATSATRVRTVGTTATTTATTTTTVRDPFKIVTTTTAPSPPAPSATVSPAAVTTISIGSAFVFSPANVTIHVGDTVTWQHDSSSVMHSVTADDGSFDSSPSCPSTCLGANSSFSHTFTKAGTFRYYCKIHGAPGGVGMSGIITVQAATTTTTSPSASTTIPQSTAGTPSSPTPGGSAASAATPSASLPRTGSNPVPLLLAGAAALLLGLAAVASRRRLRPTR